jgi:glycosyltransferase involved in cell wall biosynthesis
MTRYSALIRTFNSEGTLPATLEKLSRQTVPPSEFIFVDSGSTDNTITLAPPHSILHKYQGLEFNFAEAINQGLEYISADYVLIISSHTLLNNVNAIEYAIGLLDTNEYLGACYFSYENDGELRYVIIDRNNFDGFNGLWNTCSLVRYDLLSKRKFRTEVFSAEDQEWARWLFEYEDKGIARVNGAGLDLRLNQRMQEFNWRKRKNEYVAVAYFANPDLMTVTNLARIAYRVLKPTTRPFRERYFNLSLLFELCLCFLRKPRYKSRYF